MKKLFMISVTGTAKSMNRVYSETICEILNKYSPFSKGYIIETHVDSDNTDLYESLREALEGNKYEGYIVVLDCLDISEGVYNPNVMMEFGIIRTLAKPFVVVSSMENEKHPFDVRNINIIHIPNCITEYIKNKYKETQFDIPDLLETNKKEIKFFLDKTYNIYIKSPNSVNDSSYVTNGMLMNEIQELKKLFRDTATAEYIDGEAAAFSALAEAIGGATKSLRTTRFANESIVSIDKEEQKYFMKNLYEASIKLKENFERIICNNHPAKWKDVYNIMLLGGNGSQIYIRKVDFSIHFELVIIDEKIAFIHFYQNNHSNETNDGNASDVEKINSTLKIQGSSICQKLAKIFDRLHHRDFESGTPAKPSRTLLGMRVGDDDNNENIGYFQLNNSVPEYDQFSNNENAGRKKAIKNLLRHSFEIWNFDNDEDKLNMVVGIALIEEKTDFIDNMHNNKLDDEEYKIALELYNQYAPNIDD